MSSRLKGYLLAGASIVACYLTCAAIVHADDGLRIALGRDRAVVRTHLCWGAIEHIDDLAARPGGFPRLRRAWEVCPPTSSWKPDRVWWLP